jgi:ferrochelatase
MNKKAILLINTGTPDAPTVKAVRSYLSQFLNDPRVIDLPWLAHKLLVNLIIIPFRSPKSARLYRKIWTPEGSPLLLNSRRLKEKLQQKLAGKASVFFAMRYGNPSIQSVIEEINRGKYNELLIVPLFPQHASSTTGSIVDALKHETANSKINVRFVEQFYKHPAFIDAFAAKIEAYKPAAYDHVVFSYHGLPNRHLDKSHPGISHKTCTCEHQMPAHGQHCYKATCYETTRLLSGKLGLKPGDYTVAFQSRLSNNWMEPFTDRLLKDLAQKGVKKVLVTAPAFVADCLETTLELGVEYSKFFSANGGNELTLVESLNADDKWVKALAEIIFP